jgi:hypothetical protein
MEPTILLHRLTQRLRHLFRHLFGLGDHRLADVFRQAQRHPASVVWATLFTVIHVAMGSHDTLSLLGIVDLKPEWHFMHVLEPTLAGLVWLGHLLGDD